MIDPEQERRHLGIKERTFDRILYAIVVFLAPVFLKFELIVIVIPVILTLSLIALIMIREWKFESDRLARHERGRRYEHARHIG